MEQALPYIWLGVIVLAALIEALTAQFVSIWFAAGGIGALIALWLGGPIWVQLTIFGVVSLVTVLLTRPLVNKIIKTEKTKTNADRYVGRSGKVIVSINNQQGTGQVQVDGNVWSARTTDGTMLKTDEEVIVESIQGVKLMVRKQK